MNTIQLETVALTIPTILAILSIGIIVGMLIMGYIQSKIHYYLNR